MKIESITTEQIVAWLADKELAYGMRIGCMASYNKPFHAMSDSGCEFGDTPEEAVRLVNENKAAKTADNIATLRLQAEEISKRLAALEAKP